LSLVFLERCNLSHVRTLPFKINQEKRIPLGGALSSDDERIPPLNNIIFRFRESPITSIVVKQPPSFIKSPYKLILLITQFHMHSLQFLDKTQPQSMLLRLQVKIIHHFPALSPRRSGVPIIYD
jgi:hypothetical protein